MIAYLLQLADKHIIDKHGLVNHFSRVLEENGINHMYSSTFKTANLLVNFILPPTGTHFDCHSGR
jgi:hypothetical protein